MTTVLVIAVLMGMVVAIAAYALHRNDYAQARADIERIKTRLEEYHGKNGVYTSDVAVLTPQNTDPWGQKYIITLIGKYSYEVYSIGPDGRPDTEDDVKAGSTAVALSVHESAIYPLAERPASGSA